jgi:hypothetical protein
MTAAMEGELASNYQNADQLPPEAWDDLDARNPQEAAAATGAQWDGEAFHLPLLGRDYLVLPRQRCLQGKAHPDRPVSFQAALVMVHTLARALDVPPSGRMVTPQELPGGSMFFVGPHAIPTDLLCGHFGRNLDALTAQAKALGGHAISGADAAVTVPGLPRVPMFALIWDQDDEFPARAVVGVDSHAHHHLALDALWALSNVFAHHLVGKQNG